MSKEKKKRSDKYEDKLKISGSLNDVLKVSIETKKHGDKKSGNKN